MTKMQPTLYLFVGYPGAGKTSVARIIAEASGGIHLWADDERQRRFGTPELNQDQLTEFYDELNQQTADWLDAGQTVIFDTNFNYRRDRDMLRELAAAHGARCIVIWMTTPVEISRIRAVENADGKDNRVWGNMDIHDFEKLSCRLEAPTPDEQAIEINGSIIDPIAIRRLLDL